jgi:hypothetical protein
MARSTLVLLGCLLWTAPVWSKGTIHVVTDVPSEVLLDNQPVGETPVTLHNIPKGPHEIKITARDSKDQRVIPLLIPGHVFISKEFAVNFQKPLVHPKPSPAPAPVAMPAEEKLPPVLASGPVPPPAVVAPPRSSRSKFIRRRIIAGAVTLIGLLTGAEIVTGLGLGGGAMNEVIHHDEEEDWHQR